MKEILGYVIITSPLWLLGVGVVVLFGWVAVKAILIATAFIGFVYGSCALGLWLLE